MIPLRDKLGSVFDWLPATIRFRFLRPNLKSLLCVPLQEPSCLIRVFEITIRKRQTRTIGAFESSGAEVVSMKACFRYVPVLDLGHECDLERERFVVAACCGNADE